MEYKNVTGYISFIQTKY
ncbi:hypothetical protein ACVPOR_15980 [Staphylococcus aureus]